MSDKPVTFSMTAEAIEKVLQKNMSPGEGWAQCNVTGPLFATRTSQIFQASLPRHGTTVAIKCTSPEEAKEQFDALEKTAKLLEDIENCASPAPIALFDREGILVMDWIDGLSFQDMCLGPGTPRMTIERAIVQCARMLAALHRPSHVQANPLDTADFLNDVDIAMNGREPARPLKPTLTFLQESAARIAQEALPVAILHGDFKSANLLIKGPDIFAIDAAMKWEGATVHDVAHFLNQFALDLYHPKAWRLRPTLNGLEALFLKTYKAEGGNISRRALQWLRLQKLIMLHTEHCQRNSIASKYLAICLRFEIHRVIKDTED